MTVQEQLKAAGFTDDDIAAMGDKIKGIESVYNSAAAEREAAEKAQRAAAQVFENDIAPVLNDWGNKEANLTAERDYYKTLAEKAKDGGFVTEVPPFKAGDTQRGPDGKFTANSNTVPGSPDVRKIEEQAGQAIFTLQDLTWKYQSLYGKPLPDAPSKLFAEAQAQRMTMVDYAAKKYDFAGKEAAMQAAAQKEHDDAIRKEAREAADREWAEKVGNNPNIRMAQPSRYTEIKKAVAEGKRQDPIKLTREERHAASAAAIREEVAAAVN